MANIIIEGDGSWQNSLDAGRCPKCGATIDKNVCTSCKLVIIDSKARSDTMKEDTMPSEWENDMYETKLMPSEDDLCSVPEKMYWSDAVTTIEGVVEDWLSYAQISDDMEERVRSSWKRVLQG
jgi:hypothetical protein